MGVHKGVVVVLALGLTGCWQGMDVERTGACVELRSGERLWDTLAGTQRLGGPLVAAQEANCDEDIDFSFAVDDGTLGIVDIHVYGTGQRGESRHYEDLMRSVVVELWQEPLDNGEMGRSLAVRSDTDDDQDLLWVMRHDGLFDETFPLSDDGSVVAERRSSLLQMHTCGSVSTYDLYFAHAGGETMTEGTAYWVELTPSGTEYAVKLQQATEYIGNGSCDGFEGATKTWFLLRQ